LSRKTSILLLFLLPLVAGCGYRAVYGGVPERLHVKLVRTMVPDTVASDEVASGVREELARQGALDAGEGYPRVEIEVLRASEASEGIAAGTSGPLARATDVAIVGRAWLIRAPGASPEGDSGDMRAEELITVDVTEGARDPRSSGFHHADALRAAARRLGRKLAHKVTGQPAASEDAAEGL